MKYIKVMLVCAFTAWVSLGLNAQTTDKIDVDGRVLGADGKPLKDAVITSEKEGVSTVTDSTGTFSLEVSSAAILAVSAPGHETKFFPATARLDKIGLALETSSQPVQVAYRTVNPEDVMGGISYINMPDMLEKNYITYSLANMEGFVGGFNGNLWGHGEYLLLVDGVPRDAGSVMPTEIDQVTFLKGVSAVALYGSRAAKGAILITTKRGAAGQRTIDVRANAGIHVPKRYPKYLGSAEYMSLYNEARTNDGLSELYTEEDIYNHAAGVNPYRYPNVDYFSSEYLQEVYSRYDATMQISGGNERARYYTNLGFYTEGSVLDFGQAKDNSDHRFNIRGNVDMNLNRILTANVNAAAIYYSGRGVNANYWSGAGSLRPHRFTPLVPISMIEEEDTESMTLVNNTDNLIGGKYVLGGTQLDQTNPIASIYAGGSNVYNSRQFQFNSSINADLGDLLEGLSFSTLFGVDYSTTYNLSFQNDYAVFEPSWNSYDGYDQISTLTKFGQDASTREQNIANSWFRQTFAMSGVLSYSNIFNDAHQVTAMLTAGGFQRSFSAEYHRVANANMGLHFGYNYLSKYYVDFNGALVHSAKLPEDNRQAFSPTLTLGWRLSNEGFLASSSTVNNLRLYVSGGILHTDMDIGDYYLYESIYRQTDGAWYTWKDGLQNQSTDSRRGENMDMTLPKREEVNVGLDVALFQNMLRLNGSAFISRMSGMVVQNDVLFPNYFTTGYPNTSFIPYVNYNDDQRYGFDFNLSVNQRVGAVDLTLGVAGTYYNTKATKRAEIWEYDYQNRQGRPLDAIWGLENDGFFADQADIDNSPEQAFGEVKPGDIKYVDQNGDNVINDQDQVYLGRYGWSGAPLTVGVNLTAKWKNLTFFALGVVRNGAHSMRSGDYFWVNGEDKYSEIVKGRWTPETSNTATYPRLTTQNGNNNFRNSDFWIYSTNRFDLARVQVTYTIPKDVLGTGFFNELGVYVNGANLLTIAPNQEILETNIGSAPQTRFFNLGVTALF